MKPIDTHKTNECNEAITLTVDEPDPEYGNASHLYDADWVDSEGRDNFLAIHFQRGPIKEVGVNGVTNEVLLAVLIDRLKGFQSGEFACHENALALASVEFALTVLKERTKKRVARGVEGTNVP